MTLKQFSLSPASLDDGRSSLGGLELGAGTVVQLGQGIRAIDGQRVALEPGPQVFNLLTDAQGIPLSVILTGANRHDVTQLLPQVAAIQSVEGMRGTPHGSGLGKTRCVIERTIAWLHQFRRLCVHNERLDSMH